MLTLLITRFENSLGRLTSERRYYDTYPRVQLSTLSGRIVCGLVSIRRLSRGVSNRNAERVTFRLEFQRDGGVCMPCHVLPAIRRTGCQ